MTPPRASNQVGLWRRGKMLLPFLEIFPCGIEDDGMIVLVARSARIIDEAILKMMEKGDE